MNKFKLTLATVLTAMSFNAMAQGSNNPIKCEPEVKAAVVDFMNMGFKNGEIAELLAIRATDGKEYKLCSIVIADETISTFANCKDNVCKAKYRGWFATKVK